MTLPFDMHIAVAKRILNAKAKRLAMLSDAGGTKNLLPYNGWTQEKIVLHDFIAPRLQRLKTSVFGPPQPNRALDRLDMAWILSLWRGERSAPTIHHKYTLDKIELMLNLVGNPDSFKPEFWAEIAQWQLRAYKELCAKLLEEFHSTITMDPPPDDEYFQMCCSVLEAAVQRALAEREPSPSNVAWTDVFASRVILQDPTVRAVIDAEMNVDGQPYKLDELIEDPHHRQPSFPPARYALEF
ncbi:hypothetical protein FRC00_009064, partial [Tulasnella sp. 408]